MTVPEVSTTMWLSLLHVFVHLFTRAVGQSVGECVSVGSLPSPESWNRNMDWNGNKAYSRYMCTCWAGTSEGGF